MCEINISYFSAQAAVLYAWFWYLSLSNYYKTSVVNCQHIRLERDRKAFTSLKLWKGYLKYNDLPYEMLSPPEYS